jgi:hypothetical protein
MNNENKKKVTPVLDPLQVKIALLKAGLTLGEWSRLNGFVRPTAWRAMNNMHGGGPIGRKAKQGIAARHALAAFVEQVNNAEKEKEQ